MSPCASGAKSKPQLPRLHLLHALLPVDIRSHAIFLLKPHNAMWNLRHHLRTYMQRFSDAVNYGPALTCSGLPFMRLFIQMRYVERHKCHASSRLSCQGGPDGSVERVGSQMRIMSYLRIMSWDASSVGYTLPFFPCHAGCTPFQMSTFQISK